MSFRIAIFLDISFLVCWFCTLPGEQDGENWYRAVLQLPLLEPYLIV